MRSLLCVAALAVVSVYAAEKCDLKDVDACTKDILPYAARQTMGVTPEEIAADCAAAEKSIKCMRELTENGCTKSGIALGVFKLMVEGAEKESAQRCNPDDKKGQDYRKLVPCLNKVGAKLQRCQKRMTAEVEANLKAPLKERIPRSCCAFAKLEKCVQDVATKECSAEHGKYVAGIVNSIAEAAVETICTRFTEESCKKFSPLKVSERTKYETLITPVVAVLTI